MRLNIAICDDDKSFMENLEKMLISYSLQFDIDIHVDKYQNGSKTVYEIIPIAGNILEKASYVNSSYLKQSYKNTSELIKTDDKISVIKSPFKK